MESGFWAFVFAALVLFFSLFIGGFYVDGGGGLLMKVAGGLGVFAWLIFMFNLMSAMNTDI